MMIALICMIWIALILFVSVLVLLEKYKNARDDKDYYLSLYREVKTKSDKFEGKEMVYEMFRLGYIHEIKKLEKENEELKERIRVYDEQALKEAADSELDDDAVKLDDNLRMQFDDIRGEINELRNLIGKSKTYRTRP